MSLGVTIKEETNGVGQRERNVGAVGETVLHDHVTHYHAKTRLSVMAGQISDGTLSAKTRPAVMAPDATDGTKDLLCI
jgi:hypothetical protein